MSSTENNNNSATPADNTKPATPAATQDLTLTPEEEIRFKTILSVGEECIQEDELKRLLKSGRQPVCYDGFEPSGRIHIAQGIMKAINVNKLTKSGCKFIFWVADWFAMLNNKMGGDLSKIRDVGSYMIEVWKAVGMDMNNVEFVWTSDEINKRAAEYWPLMLDISSTFNLSRVLRCSQIMGRSESDNLSAAQIFYPCMQCTDIFFLKADICQLGMDQRKVNVLAREYCETKKIKKKPIILSHHMLMGLKQGQAKMSKSDPNSAIFMEDSPDDVRFKIDQAFCPENTVQDNPVLEYLKYIIFEVESSLSVDLGGARGVRVYNSYAELEADFVSGVLTSAILKELLISSLNKILEPVREHFKQPGPAELLEKVRSYRVTK